MTEPLADVDVDTVGCWRDDLIKIKNMCRMNIGTSGGSHILQLKLLIDKMSKEIDDCNGLNSDGPTEEDMKSAHDCNKFHREQQEKLIE